MDLISLGCWEIYWIRHHVVKNIFWIFSNEKLPFSVRHKNWLLIYLKGLFKKQFNEKFSQFVLIICCWKFSQRQNCYHHHHHKLQAVRAKQKKENFYSPTLVLMSERTTSIFMGLLSLFLHPFFSISFLRKTFSKQWESFYLIYSNTLSNIEFINFIKH